MAFYCCTLKAKTRRQKFTDKKSHTSICPFFWVQCSMRFCYALCWNCWERARVPTYITGTQMIFPTDGRPLQQTILSQRRITPYCLENRAVLCHSGLSGIYHEGMDRFRPSRNDNLFSCLFVIPPHPVISTPVYCHFELPHIVISTEGRNLTPEKVAWRNIFQCEQ